MNLRRKGRHTAAMVDWRRYDGEDLKTCLSCPSCRSPLYFTGPGCWD